MGSEKELDAEERKYATNPLFEAVYDELRGLARAHLRRNQACQSLSATGLVHEAFFKLMSPTEQKQWDTRGHFFSSAARAMRQILVDRARKRQSLKRGGDHVRIALDVYELTGTDGPMNDERLLELDKVLDKFAVDYPVESELVHLKFFAGMSFQDAARVIEIPESDVRRKWQFAKAKLMKLMTTSS